MLAHVGCCSCTFHASSVIQFLPTFLSSCRRPSAPAPTASASSQGEVCHALNYLAGHWMYARKAGQDQCKTLMMVASAFMQCHGIVQCHEIAGVGSHSAVEIDPLAATLFQDLYELFCHQDMQACLRLLLDTAKDVGWGPA